MAADAFKAGLHVFEQRITEGFFADKVVLVEGVSDKAVIEGYARSQEYDLDANGIVVVSVDGKTKMDKPLFAFDHFGIPVYAVFDNDRRNDGKKEAKKPSYNRLIQRMAGDKDVEDWPEKITEKYACFDGDLENYLKLASGEKYEGLRAEVAAHFSLKPSDIEKTPAAVSAFIALAAANGIRFLKFDQMLNHIRR